MGGATSAVLTIHLGSHFRPLVMLVIYLISCAKSYWFLLFTLV